MSLRVPNWTKPALTLIVLLIVRWIAPVAPLDPWQLLSPKKIATMIVALAAIQAFGSVMAQSLGSRTGAILIGFFGGLISSTATTASLAKRSKGNAGQGATEGLIFLSATGAMLFEGLALLIAGSTVIHISGVILFLGPILATAGMIFLGYRKNRERAEASGTSVFQILPILKLTLFIIAVLSVSKILQNTLGGKGLVVLTSLVSLFEIHASVIANVQLHESEGISIQFLCSLLAVSVAASFISKLFLISFLGSAALRMRTIKATIILFCSLAVSWGLAVGIVSR